MIVIKMELWHGGDPKRRISLGSAVITNISSLAQVSRYLVTLLKGERYSSRPGDVYKQAEVPRFPREDKRFGPWELLALGLEATVGDRISRLKSYLGSLQ